MPRLKGELDENITRQTQAICRTIRDRFKAAPAGGWITQAQLGLKKDTSTSRRANSLLRGLVTHKVLEQRTTDNHGELTYRPTAGGWEVLRHLDNFPPSELHRKFFLRTVGGEALNCTTCGDRVTDRRLGCRICWGCEMGNVRRRNGMDHVPRTEAFLKQIRGGAAAAAREVDRVNMARRERSMRPVPVPPREQPDSRPVEFKVPPVSFVSEDFMKRIEARIDELGLQLQNLCKYVQVGSSSPRVGNGHDKSEEAFSNLSVVKLAQLLNTMQQLGLKL